MILVYYVHDLSLEQLKLHKPKQTSRSGEA